MDKWERFNKIVYGMLKLAYINLLWILFILVGLGIFGFFPATAAMFTIVRKMIKGDNEIKFFKKFWFEFRKNFFQLNAFGLIFIAVIYFLYYDFSFLALNSGKLQFLYPILILISISTILTLAFFFPVFSHFKLRFFQYLKQSLLIAITCPIEVIQIILSAALIGIVTYFIPGIIPLFTGSVFAYLTTKISHNALNKVEIRKGL